MNDGGGPWMRERARLLLEEAARAGFDDPARLLSMGLRDAELALTAHAARLRLQRERDERLAWMAGYYAAIAVHAPRRYPRRSGTAFRAMTGPMTEEQMKAALLGFAAGHTDGSERSGYDAGDAED